MYCYFLLIDILISGNDLWAMTTSWGADAQQIPSLNNTQHSPTRYKFYPTFFNGTWVSDKEILFRDRVGCFDYSFMPESALLHMHYLLQFGGLSIRDVSTSSTRTAVSHNQLLQIHPASYKFSADRSVFVNPLIAPRDPSHMISPMLKCSTFIYGNLFHLHLC